MHVDMDAFYASIEQKDNPALQGKPVIVGGGGARGVVSAASYEVRKFGVHSAMPIAQALLLCPNAVLVPVRMARYVEVSRRVLGILQQYSPLVEQASVDEAYLDATGLGRLFGPVESMARQIKESIRLETGLTCSIGLAPVKFLAKIASDLNKPDGLAVLAPEGVSEFLRTLAIGKIPGVGKAMLQSLELLGVRTGGDVRRYSKAFWERRFGKAGIALYDRAHGIDPRPVQPFVPPKSESAETTFETDTRDLAFLKDWLFRHADRVGRSLRKHKLKGNVITLKVKYADFRLVTRRCTLPAPTCSTETIYQAACDLLDRLPLEKRVRLIGVGVSGFGGSPQQLLLPFSNTAQEQEARCTRLDILMDTLQARFGAEALLRGRMLHPLGKKSEG